MRLSCESKFDGVYDYFFWCSAFVYQNLRQSSRWNKAVQCFLCAYKAPLFIRRHTVVMWLTWLRTWRCGFVIIDHAWYGKACCIPAQFCLHASVESWCVFGYPCLVNAEWLRGMSELDEQWICIIWLCYCRVCPLDTMWSPTSPRVHSA